MGLTLTLPGGGLTGLLDPVAPGFACGSDTAHMSILGYDPVMCVALVVHRSVREAWI